MQQKRKHKTQTKIKKETARRTTQNEHQTERTGKRKHKTGPRQTPGAGTLGQVNF